MSNRIYLDFKVNGMDLSRANFPCIADGSDKFIYARFSFSEEWAGATKYAIVARNNKTYVLTVADDNTVEIEREAVRTSGRFEIAMTGKIGSVVLTTIPAVVNVESTDFRDNPYGAETRLSQDVIFATLAAMDAKVATVEGYKNTVAALAETVNEQHAQVALDKAAVAADKTSAASSAAAALASSAAAGLSETNAKNSEDAAAISAAAANEQASLATGKATEAGNSAAAALGYKNAAEAAKTDAAGSATAAAGSAATAAGSAAAALTSETNAADSAAAALSSKNSASDSNSAAAGSAAAALASAEAAAASAASVAGIVGQVETNTANISANTVAIGTLNGDIANRLEKNQGAENAGKYLKVNASGTVECAEVGEWETLADVELEEASRVIEFSPEALVAKKLNSDYKHLLVAMYIPKNAEATSNFIISIMLGRNNPFDSDSVELYFPQSLTWGGLQAGHNIYCSIMIDFVKDAIMVTQRNSAYSAITYPQNVAGTTYITNNKDKEKLSKNEKIYVCVACKESVYPSFPIGTKIKLYAR